METVEYLSPDGLHRNPAFSQVVTVSGPHRTVYVGGQNAVDSGGKIHGRGDALAQAAQVANNLETALEAGGARLAHVVKWTVYIVQGQPLMECFEVMQQAFGDRMPNAPTISVVQVAGLAHADFLLEIDAVAVVPADD